MAARTPVGGEMSLISYLMHCNPQSAAASLHKEQAGFHNRHTTGDVPLLYHNLELEAVQQGLYEKQSSASTAICSLP